MPELAYFRWLHDLLPAPFFNTQAFLLFFLVVATVYWLMPRRWKTLRVWWLVLASFHFYAAWSAELAFLVLGTTVADYCFARLMNDVRLRRLRLMLLLTSVGMNLGILSYFKYCDFFLQSINSALTKAGYDPAFATLTVLIPFGISFYTFEAISYAVDVYRGKVKPERSLPHFLLFILFFPHLVAGPIVRAGDFLRQAHRPKRWNWLRVQVGVQLFLLGVFKKMAIADRMAQFCDPVLAASNDFNTSAVWLAVLAYAVRIYADFSGYSDMALGLAHLLGYRLTTNFDLPYLSANVSEFWRRWHISLSSWLRDYLYIPLGGSRGRALATQRNLMLTMLLGGLWHGAAWSYVVWGGLHGLFLIVHRQFRAWCEPRPRFAAALETGPGTALRILFTFFCVSMAWVFFRPDVQGALDVLSRMFAYSPGQPLLLSNRSLWYTVGFVFGCMWLWRWGVVQRVWLRMPPAAMGAGYAVCLCAAMLLAPPVGKTFIYFTF
jgi:alginate O-acetyltransferase complex protein AlgI